MAKASAAVSAPAVKSDPAKGAKYVTVACKFPVGMALQLCAARKEEEQTPMGSRTRITHHKVGKIHYVRGPGQPNGQTPKGYKRPDVSDGGYALTRNIPADFWEQWLEQNKDAPYVVNKIIFAAGSYDLAEGESNEHADVRSGFEPLVPDDDPRIAKSQNPAVENIKTADRTAP